MGAKGKEVDNFVDKLKLEGENIILPSTGKRPEASKALVPPVNVERYGGQPFMADGVRLVVL